jgi:hypothetical protein
VAKVLSTNRVSIPRRGAVWVKYVQVPPYSEEAVTTLSPAPARTKVARSSEAIRSSKTEEVVR